MSDVMDWAVLHDAAGNIASQPRLLGNNLIGNAAGRWLGPHVDI